MIWWTLVGLAFAETGEDPLEHALLELREAHRAPIVALAAGSDAEKAVDRALREHADLQIVVSRIPTAGDLTVEISRALEAADHTCGLVVTPSADGSPTAWDTTPAGNCAPISLALVADAPATTVSAAATDDAPEMTAKQHAAAQAQYDRQRFNFRYDSPDAPWWVTDGQDNPLTPRRFADLTQDEDVLYRLEDERDSAARRRRILAYTGLGIATTAIIPLIGANQLSAAQQQDRMWTAVFITSVGGLTAVAAPLSRKGLDDRQHQLDRYFPEETVQEVVVEMNNRLYQDLGLEQPDAVVLPMDDDSPADDTNESVDGDATSPDSAPMRVVIPGAPADAPMQVVIPTADPPSPAPEGPTTVVLPAAEGSDTAPADAAPADAPPTASIAAPPAIVLPVETPVEVVTPVETTPVLVTPAAPPPVVVTPVAPPPTEVAPTDSTPSSDDAEGDAPPPSGSAAGGDQ